MQCPWIRTCAGDLEEIILFKLLEDAPFDFDELIGYQESK